MIKQVIVDAMANSWKSGTPDKINRLANRLRREKAVDDDRLQAIDLYNLFSESSLAERETLLAPPPRYCANF